MIKFLCPNGHPLSAPENLVGKPGKCPKCQSAFIVPQPEPEEHEDTSVDVGSPAASPSTPAASPPPAAEKAGGDTAVGSASSGSEIAAGVAMDSPSGKGGASGKSKAGAGLFVFLCPNGHRLNGPPTLKGKPGQCPHCGARFRIPADDDDLEPEPGIPVEDEIPAGEAVEEEIPAGTLEEEAPEAAPEAYDPPVEPVPPGLHALCYILGRLWDRKTEEQILEIYTTEGEILSPDYYSEILSTADYAVFATVDGDGYAISVTPWSTVRKIALKKVKNISPNVFR